MIPLPTEDGVVYINPLLVAAVAPYMKNKDKCKVIFSEEKGNFLVIQQSAEITAETISLRISWLHGR